MSTLYRVGKPLSEPQAMEAALIEASKGRGFVSPNPLVGCAILNSKKCLLSLGHHAAFGKDHAEINAIKKIIPAFDLQLVFSKKKNRNLFQRTFSPLKGTHFFVTLEPCSFIGNTPACAKILSQLPIASLTYGILDPHPKVSGSGIKILRASGIHVKQISNIKLRQKIEDLTEIFLHNIKYQKPFISLKIATSLDGQIAIKENYNLKKTSFNLKNSLNKPSRIKWLSHEKARNVSHFLRGSYDAILVGYKTLLLDNPFLNIRHKLFSQKKNTVLILDPEGQSLKFLHQLNLTSCHNEKDIFIIIKNSLSQKIKHLKKNLKVNLIPCPLLPLRFPPRFPSQKLKKELDLNFLMRFLYKKSIMSLYVEGGAGVHSSFFNQFQVQRIYQFLSPRILGAKFSLPWTKDFGIKDISKGIRLKRIKVTFIKDNILITGRV